MRKIAARARKGETELKREMESYKKKEISIFMENQEGKDSKKQKR